MDTIYLNGLVCECIIGVWEWEQHVKQKLVLNIELKTDISAAAASDDLNDALNYQRVAEQVTELCANSRLNLLETLAEQIASMILENFSVLAVKINIDKGSAVSNARQVGVIIERGRAN